jgi:hypothetical protein
MMMTWEIDSIPLLEKVSGSFAAFFMNHWVYATFELQAIV